MSTHFVVKCDVCGAVVRQCRCPDANKTVSFETCHVCHQQLARANVVGLMFCEGEPTQEHTWTIRQGDVVVTRTGGARMNVERIENGIVHCTWMPIDMSRGLQHAPFFPESLCRPGEQLL